MKKLILLAVALAAVAACEPARQMQVRGGQHPNNIDKNVRFRTTYYFRTFDYCYGKGVLNHEPEIVILPETDSLYRFRMTGKARAMFDTVHFESGILPAAQIDPFGSKIIYDKDLGGFRFASQQEIDAAARRKTAKNEMDTLFGLLERIDNIKEKNNQTEYDELRGQLLSQMKASIGAMTTDGYEPEEPPKNVDAAQQAISLAPQTSATKLTTTKQQQLDSLRAGLRQRDPYADDAELEFYAFQMLRDLEFEIENDSERDAYISKFGNKGADDPDDDSSAKSAQIALQGLRGARKGGVDSIACPKDAPVRRGFQIMGPEGWRTFNQDERLIMAMSSSAQPLIGVLQEYSDRLLNAKADASAQKLTLTEEYLRIVHAERELDNVKLANQDVETALDLAIAQFKKEETKQ